ncbi:hypothetical protein niasHS_016343 [Heterodera schachtii]|uniref:Uncharacterized protein n=1 Tax=Heterodera schachtii TaxID=97005 RepID=A0ABD2HYL7_HETSC
MNSFKFIFFLSIALIFGPSFGTVGIKHFILWRCLETDEMECEDEAKELTERFCKEGYISDEGGGRDSSFGEQAEEECFDISCFMKDQFIDVSRCTNKSDSPEFGKGCQCDFGKMVPIFLRGRRPAPAASTTSSITTASTTTSSTTTASTTSTTTTASTTTSSTTTTTKALPLPDNAGTEVSNRMTDSSSSRATVIIYFEELPIPSGNGSRGNAGIFWTMMPMIIALAFLCLI